MVAKRRRVALVAARKAAGYTQERLAAALPVDRSTVIRWEAGDHAPVPYMWPKLAKLLRVTPERLQALLLVDDEPVASPPAVPAMRASQAVALEDMKRRTLMKWGVAATAAAGLSASAGRSVGLADVQRLERSAARLHSLDQQHGGDSLWQAALVQAHEGERLLEHGSYTSTVGQQLLSATGRLQICAGWLALDAGEHEVARTCFGEALAMSRQANDAQVETRALANLAYQSNMLNRPREALRYAAGAEQAATGRGATTRLAVIPQLRIAVSHGLVGNAREADRAIATARQVLDREQEAPDEEWSAFVSHAEIDGIEAIAAIELGRSQRGARLLEPTLSGVAPAFARNLAGRRIQLVRARLEMGAVDGAAEAAHAALDDLTGEVASWRLTTQLAAVAQAMAAYPTVDGVASFFARYQAVQT